MKFFVHTLHYQPYPKPISRLLGDLINGMHDSNYEVVVFTARYGQNPISISGEKIVRIPNLGFLSEYLPLKLLDYISFYSFGFFAAVWLQIFYRPSHVIYRSGFGISSLFAFLTCKLLKRKVYFWVLDRYPDILFENKLFSNNIIFKILKNLEIFLQKNVSGVIFETKSDQNDYIENGGIDNSIQISTWSEEVSGLSMEEPSFWAEKELNKKMVFLFSGNISNSIEIDAMLSFFEHNNDYVLLILGEGSEKASLISMVRSRNLSNVLIFKFQKLPVYRFLLKNSDFGVVSLKNNISIFSSKLTSYISAGLPILAFLSQKNEMTEIILNNKCGYVISDGATISKNMIQDTKKNINMAHRSKSLAKQYSKDYSVSRFIEFLS